MQSSRQRASHVPRRVLHVASCSDGSVQRGVLGALLVRGQGASRPPPRLLANSDTWWCASAVARRNVEGRWVQPEERVKLMTINVLWKFSRDCEWQTVRTIELIIIFVYSNFQVKKNPASRSWHTIIFSFSKMLFQSVFPLFIWNVFLRKWETKQHWARNNISMEREDRGKSTTGGAVARYLQEWLRTHWHVLQQCSWSCSCKVSAPCRSVGGRGWLVAGVWGGVWDSATVCESESRSGAPLTLLIIKLISFTADWTESCAERSDSAELCAADSEQPTHGLHHQKHKEQRPGVKKDNWPHFFTALVGIHAL